MLGHKQLRAWVLLMVVADASDVVEEQLTAAMTRARMCELLSIYEPSVRADTAFFAGLLSSLDFLLNMPMREVVERLPLDAGIARALVDREGPLGGLIETVAAYEVADLEALAASSIELSDLAPAYLNAIAWSMSVTAEAISA